MLQIRSLFINGKQKWARFDMHGNFVEQTDAPGNVENWEILCKFRFGVPRHHNHSFNTSLIALISSHANMGTDSLPHHLLVGPDQ